MNSKQRYNAKRAEAHRAERRKDCELARDVGSALCGSERVHKAISSTDYKMCLRPRRETTIGQYEANPKYQKVTNEAGRQIHAVQRVRGKSIPLI